jgi:hypothetical protein
MSASGSHDAAPFAAFNATNAVSMEDLNRLIQKVWDEVQNDSGSRELASQYSGVPQDLLVGKSPPFVAGPESSNFGLAGTIAVFIAMEASKALLAHGVDQLWDQVFWPRVKALFGAKLKPK